MDIISRSLVGAWFPGSGNGVLPDYIHFRGLSGPSLGRGSLCPADYPYFKSPGERGRPLKSSRVQVRAEYVYSPPLLLLLLLLLGHPCPPHDLTNVPGLALSRVFFSFSSLPIGSLLDPVLLLLCIFRRIIYIIEIVLRNEISKILDVLL